MNFNVIFPSALISTRIFSSFCSSRKIHTSHQVSPQHWVLAFSLFSHSQQKTTLVHPSFWAFSLQPWLHVWEVRLVLVLYNVVKWQMCTKYSSTICANVWTVRQANKLNARKTASHDTRLDSCHKHGMRKESRTDIVSARKHCAELTIIDFRLINATAIQAHPFALAQTKGLNSQYKQKERASISKWLNHIGSADDAVYSFVHLFLKHCNYSSNTFVIRHRLMLFWTYEPFPKRRPSLRLCIFNVGRTSRIPNRMDNGIRIFGRQCIGCKSTNTISERHIKPYINIDCTSADKRVTKFAWHWAQYWSYERRLHFCLWHYTHKKFKSRSLLHFDFNLAYIVFFHVLLLFSFVCSLYFVLGSSLSVCFSPSLNSCSSFSTLLDIMYSEQRACIPLLPRAWWCRTGLHVWHGRWKLDSWTWIFPKWCCWGLYYICFRLSTLLLYAFSILNESCAARIAFSGIVLTAFVRSQ